MEGFQGKWMRLLSIDGGSSGLPALYTMDEILSRLAFDLKSNEELMPWRHFELMIGTGPGGLVVILIGRLRLSPSQASKAYMKLEAVMPRKPAKDDQERRKNSTAFKTAFLEVLKMAGFEADTPMVDESMPKIIVCTSNTANVSVVHPIRSYRTRGALSPLCTILQAACACIASPDTFDPVTIGVDHKRAVLIDAMVGCANPTKELLREAQDMFGEDAEVASIISIGSGKGNVRLLFEDGREVGISDGLRRGIAICEQVHEDLQGRLGEMDIYYRFNVEHELSIHSEAVLAHVSAYLGEKATSARMDRAIESIQYLPTGVKLKNINSVTVIEIALKPRPSLVENFIGRNDILDSIQRTHFSPRSPQSQTPVITVLYGLGGSGKTQTALKFALMFEELYPTTPVYFLNASTEANIKSDLENILRSRETGYSSKDHHDTLAWLATKMKNWLIIMDNADNPELRLFLLMPKCGHGNIIITTRNSILASLAPNSSHHLEGLSTPDSIALLLKVSRYEYTARNQALAAEIAEELGDLPLAVAQAGGYIFIHRCLSSYLHIHRESKGRMPTVIHSALPYDYPTSVATTIQMSLERLPGGAQNLMRLFSHLDSASIAHAIISKSAERQFRRVERTDESDVKAQTSEQATMLLEIFCPSGRWSEADFNELITLCLQYSLLQVTTQGDYKFYSMHILIQSYLRALPSPVRSHHPSSLVVRLLGSSITFSPDYQHLAFNRLLLPHVRQICMDDVVEAGDHFGFGHVMEIVGDNKLAVLHFERCMEMWRGSSGDEHENTLKAMRNLAISYKAIGSFQKALELEEKVLDVQSRMLGAEHRDTLTTAGNLASSYRELGRHKEAVALGEHVLKVCMTTLGLEDADTVTIMGNLAISYNRLGRNQEALGLEHQVLKIRKKILGPEDPDTLWVMSNLSESYRIVGRKQEALELNQQALEVQKRVLGHEHPYALYSTCVRLDILRDLGMTEQLRDLLPHALSAHERVLGIDHRDTLWLKEEFRTERNGTTTSTAAL